MPRERSRSPRRDRDRRSRSRSKSRDRDRYGVRRPPVDETNGRDRERRRERSPGRRRSRERDPRYFRDRSKSHSKDRERGAAGAGASDRGRHRGYEPPKIDEKDLEGKTEEEIEMLKVMGFCDFSTTKNQHVPDNEDIYVADIAKKRRYRQYMNRRGGFNRPLDPIA